jgi:quercetin dioxygenase-like cupin family protein
MKPIHVPKQGGQAVNILGIPMLLRVHGRDTNGTLAVVESHDSLGGGPPPHIHHREDETFQVLEGEYEFMVGGKTVLAKAGDTLFAPRNVPHTYRCTGRTGGKLSVVLTPAGFEDFFAEIGALNPEQQQDIPRVIEIAKKFGLEFLPPSGD